ncbi:MAG: hypothetical protein HC828_01550 [Blastochloris sp.]|nr:hypothetical protein [Blastochloris sp.]
MRLPAILVCFTAPLNAQQRTQRVFFDSFPFPADTGQHNHCAARSGAVRKEFYMHDLSTLTNEQLIGIQPDTAWITAKSTAIQKEIETLQTRIDVLKHNRARMQESSFYAQRLLDWRTRAGRTEGDIYAEIDSLALKVANQDRPWKLAAITWSQDPDEPDTAIVTIHTPFGNVIVITFDECDGIYPKCFQLHHAASASADARVRSTAKALPI